MTAVRLARFRHEPLPDFVHPGRGAGFPTLAAATCVLGRPREMVEKLTAQARALALLGALFWAALIYLFFAATITARIKPGFTRSINGGWLVAVVSTQALAVLMTLLIANDPAAGPGWLFGALCLYLLGGALYLLIITLVVSRMVFFPLRAREFTPPYWIDMGALAITTLAGITLIKTMTAHGLYTDLIPTLKVFVVFAWIAGTWWIPVIFFLEIWRHWTIPWKYHAGYWSLVFPLGMHVVCTWQLAEVFQLTFLKVMPEVFIWLAWATWAVTFVGMCIKVTRAFLLNRSWR